MALPQRTYGRTPVDEFGNQQWVVITPDPQTGLTDLIYFATVAQTCRLSLGESPFYANYGIPAKQSVETQIPPDVYVARVQTQYSQFFASLVVSKAPPPNPPLRRPVPTYNIRAVAHSGLVLTASVPVAT